RRTRHGQRERTRTATGAVPRGPCGRPVPRRAGLTRRCRGRAGGAARTEPRLPPVPHPEGPGPPRRPDQEPDAVPGAAAMSERGAGHTTLALPIPTSPVYNAGKRDAGSHDPASLPDAWCVDLPARVGQAYPVQEIGYDGRKSFIINHLMDCIALAS